MPPNPALSDNIVKNLDFLALGYRQRYACANKVRGILAQNSVKKLEFLDECAATFSKRITSICWHPMYPYQYAAGSKFGDISVGHVQRSLTDSSTQGWSLPSKSEFEIEGSGPDGSVGAMMFDRNRRNVLYTASMDSTVSKIDLENPAQKFVYHDLASYDVWYTAMDINFDGKILTAGDSKGSFRMFNLDDGKPLGVHNLHKTKIRHIEFNKLDPTKFVTTSISEKNGASCKIWDIRKLNFKEPLQILPHNTGVNCARFSPVNGHRLLTSDQRDEIRVYEYPYSEEPTTLIKHHHAQFQHITPIKAEWHPLADLIVIGKYPKAVSKKDQGMRTIEFYNPDTGGFVSELCSHPLNGIVNLNVFNPTADLLASGMASRLIIWRPSSKLEEFGYSKSLTGEDPVEISQDLRDKLRGKGKTQRRAREYSPANSDDETDANKTTKRPRQDKQKKVPAKEKVENGMEKAAKRPSRKREG